VCHTRNGVRLYGRGQCVEAGETILRVGRRADEGRDSDQRGRDPRGMMTFEFHRGGSEGLKGHDDTHRHGTIYDCAVLGALHHPEIQPAGLVIDLSIPLTIQREVKFVRRIRGADGGADVALRV